MKIKKLNIIALGVVVLMSIAACAPQDTGMNNQNRLQTRVNQNRLNENPNWNTNDSMIDNFDDGTNTNLNTGMVRNNTGTGSIRNNNNMTTSLGNLNNNSRDLARRIAALPEVKDASVVLHNDTALVGVNLNGNNNNNNNTSNTNISSTLRNKIEDMVRDDNNNNIKNISITADPSMIDRITNISTGMGNQVGTDIRDFTSDIEQLIRDIVPGGNGGTRINSTNMNR